MRRTRGLEIGRRRMSGGRRDVLELLDLAASAQQFWRFDVADLIAGEGTKRAGYECGSGRVGERRGVAEGAHASHRDLAKLMELSLTRTGTPAGSTLSMVLRWCWARRAGVFCGRISLCARRKGQREGHAK